MKAYRIQVMVCTGTGCVSNHAFDIKEALEKEIAKHNLQNETEIVNTGCNGFCGAGPLLVVQPEGIFYQLLKSTDVPLLVEEHFLKGRPVKKLMYTPPQDKIPIPKMSEIPLRIILHVVVTKL
jgi:(2Fe-2S) ferredoxin